MTSSDYEDKRLLARLIAYQQLADELLKWRLTHADLGSISAAEAPLLWRLHQLAIELKPPKSKSSKKTRSKSSPSGRTPGSIVDEANELLRSAGIVFQFANLEFEALATLMTESRFKPLAPYSPYNRGKANMLIW